MTTIRHWKTWAGLTCLISLFVGAAAVLLADFGMPGWFFLCTQAWFWTLGLPTMLAVLVVAGLWGIPGWTTLPLWAFVSCAAITALALQTGFFLLLNRILERSTRGQS